jgi:prepilin-type N-terminal cleavage/methylation domain-containing protein
MRQIDHCDFRKKSAGFTLVEFLLTAAIMALLVVLAAMVFQRFAGTSKNQGSKLKSGSAQIEGG